MSGGSYNYAYGRIEELAADIRPSTPLRQAFKRHLMLVAEACKDIEWVDSGDCGPGDEDKAIRACLGSDAPALLLAEAVESARSAEKLLRKALAAAGRRRP